jgi:hypothetical protein
MIGLKVFGILEWSWWFVIFFPLIATAALTLGTIAFVIGVVLLCAFGFGIFAFCVWLKER